MKSLSILSLLFITLVSCNCQKKAVAQNVVVDKYTQNPMEVVYTANSRGFYQKITVVNQEVFISTDREVQKKGAGIKISDTDWKEISGYMKTLKLNDLAGFKDPTQKRFYDGAAIATLKVTDKEKEYETVAFDHGFPPVEIEKLVTKITSLVKKE